MIPLLPEIPALTLTPATPGTPPLVPTGEVSGLDFASLLGAVTPLPPVNGAAVVTITPGSFIPEDAASPADDVPAQAAAPLLPALLATGRNLPLPGAELPEAEPVAAVLTPALAPDTPEALAPAPTMRPRNMIETGDPAPTNAEVPPAPPEDEDDAPVAAEKPEHEPEQPDAATAIAIAPLVQPAPLPAASPATSPASAPTPASEIVVAASPKRPLTPRLAVARPGQVAAAPPAAETAAPPVRPSTTVASAKPEPALPAPLPASSTSTPAPAPAPGDSVAAASDPASPAAATPSAPAPVPTALAALAPAPTPAPSPERADVRADTLAPQQQSTIDQVGDLREALRSARPAMTLQHAEFGAVSVRLEATATEGWRAVLASRDPGFVPAIQTALAERAVMAAAASPDSGGFMHHSGTGDHRSGSTPNGGQGASQPYLGQSASRDGEAAPYHRRPSTAAALAARAEAEEAGSGSPGQTSGGLFA